ncbi:outer membrane beta-barrel protein [Marinifilum fragile]|uniref:outer membrane beta-barrel protein n=1 Tax=Marinifilum fragile TaxID=570161 RepID=UPI002AA863B7|nr:outer membrane beta-barrel protein [Marinifilum fragile]
MRKLLFTAIITILMTGMFNNAKAQFSVGPGLGFATDISSLGISANVGYEINEKWAATGVFTYFLEKDYVKWSTLDFNANYNLTEIENVGTLYGLGGINVTMAKIDIPGLSEVLGSSTSSSDFGLNLGAGLNIGLSDKMTLAPEVSYTISSGGYLRAGAKLMFSL